MNKDERSMLQSGYSSALPATGRSDHGRLSHHLAYLAYLSEVGSYCVSVFDLKQDRCVYLCANFRHMLGCDPYRMDSCYVGALVHPDDYPAWTQAEKDMLRFLAGTPALYRKDYKLICTYRLLMDAHGYVKVTGQWQLLELDEAGNPWLSLSIIDLAAGPGDTSGVKMRAVNLRTGEIVRNLVSAAPDKQLTHREQTILDLMRDGLLCKEIAGRLDISIHTVHTHRQRILNKLEAGNAIEAINAAKAIGLIL